MKTVVGRVR